MRHEQLHINISYKVDQDIEDIEDSGFAGWHDTLYFQSWSETKKIYQSRAELGRAGLVENWLRTSSFVWRLGTVSCGAAESRAVSGGDRRHHETWPAVLHWTLLSRHVFLRGQDRLHHRQAHQPPQTKLETKSFQFASLHSLLAWVVMVSRNLSVSNSTAILNSTKNCQWWHRWHYWGHLCVSPGSGQDSATEPEDWSQWRENV